MIKISQKFKPFANRPGTACLIPGSSWVVQAYPTLLRILGEKEHEIFLRLTGPIEQFTLMQDVDRQAVFVYGYAKEGYFNFKIFHVGKNVLVKLYRGNSIVCVINGANVSLNKGDIINVPVDDAGFKLDRKEYLHLGINKKLNWDMVEKRSDLREIFPVVFLLGQFISPYVDSNFLSPSSYSEFKMVFKSMFSGILVPTFDNGNSFGFDHDLSCEFASPVVLLRKMYEQVRKLFIYEADSIEILPTLYAEFHCGRMVDVELKDCIISLEWTKCNVRRLTIFAKKSSELVFKFTKEISSFRLRSRASKDTRHTCKVTAKLRVESGKTYFLDNFTK